MKNVAIVSLGEYTGLTIKNQIEDIVDEDINISIFNIDNIEIFKLKWDLIIFSSETVKNILITKIENIENTVVLKRSISHNCIDELLKLKKGEKVLLVNDHKESCEISIKQLKKQGIDHIKYYKYYPGISKYEKVDIAVTPGEVDLVPNYIKRVIDIKSRKMDITSLTEILIKLNLISKYRDLLSAYYYKDIVNISKKYITMANESNKLKNLLNFILDNNQEGIIYTNIENKVLILNEKALKLLKIDRENIIDKNIYELFADLKNDIIIIDNKELLITKRNLNNSEYIGNLIIINEVNSIYKIDEELRKKKKYTNNNTKYTFNDIIGESDSNIKNIKLAKKISKTNSTVLIQGESGTGKEILSQAIHNESKRKEYPFIAVNFAAISENLIESELFGYEEGAFTGAKKGGKDGLFKKAHRGTIFLDEIGDAPLHIQTKLLRVLQEREITPVGSTDIIPIDVRVIAATNKDLLNEIKNNKFREDLFYRLNVMPIYTIPLRERKEDIINSLRYYLLKLGNIDDIYCFFEKDTIEFLVNYNWPGNFRELVNIVEYLINIKEDNIKINIYDLPKYILENKEIENISTNDLDKEELWVLSKIYNYNGIGRRNLSNISYEEGINLGEGKLRRIINLLKDRDYVTVDKGLNGTKITKKGIKRVKI